MRVSASKPCIRSRPHPTRSNSRTRAGRRTWLRLRELGGNATQDRFAHQNADRTVPDALRAGDAEGVRALLEAHTEVREAINAPIGAFGGRPVSMVRKNLPVLDVLLGYGAD